MIRWVPLVAVLACTERPATPTGLRVPLAEGWVATPTAGGLSVGPKGRVVATLELRNTEVPRALELSRVATAEGATGLLQDEGEGYSAVRYSLGAGRDGFLAVKKVGAKTVWCASTARASSADVDDGLALCRSLSTETP
ncbi:MAG: hypothetical protein ABTQ32_12090 [Myxococcaceae bacterium]